MAVQLLDSYNLAQDPTFQNRVMTSLIEACISIYNEGWTVAFHRERQTFAVAVMNNPTNFKAMVANGVATDTNCINDATATGTVSITSGNAATQAALVTDTHMNTAVSSQFNTFFKTPST